MSYKPVFYFGPKEICRNAQVFATHDEALASAEARFMVWMQPTGFGVEETKDRVNYVRKDHTDYSLKGLNQ
tara:strand:+ start:317 stop:529 length:213 start_codon:yes stop_codon:yes gene_type:complete